MTKKMDMKRKEVLRIMKMGAQTHTMLVTNYGHFSGIHQSPQGIRSRCAELVALGYVIPTHHRRPSRYGRACIVWQAVRGDK